MASYSGKPPGVRPLPWLAYILIGVVPIAFDGFSQLFSQYPYNTLAIFYIFLTLAVASGLKWVERRYHVGSH